jgi:hypothetical protein
MSTLPLLTMAYAAHANLFGQPAPQPEATHAKVMIVGTFHFEDAGLDDYKPRRGAVPVECMGDRIPPLVTEETKALGGHTAKRQLRNSWMVCFQSRRRDVVEADRDPQSRDVVRRAATPQRFPLCPPNSTVEARLSPRPSVLRCETRLPRGSLILLGNPSPRRFESTTGNL